MSVSASRGWSRRLTDLRRRAERTPIIGRVLAVQARYSEDSAGFIASGIAYYGFLSLFPLMLLGLSVMGFVLLSHPALQSDLTARVSESVPGLGKLVGDNVAGLIHHRAATGIAGFVGLLWAGRGIAAAASHGLMRVFSLDERGNFFVTQAWMIGSVVALGILAVVSAAVGASVASAHVGAFTLWIRLAGFLLTLGLDFVLFLVAYRVLTMRRGPRARQMWPGALVAAVGWSVLKVAGGWYATRTVSNAAAIYGTFAGTIGILVLLSLAARIFLYGAELNAVIIDTRSDEHGYAQGGYETVRRLPLGNADRQGDRRRHVDARAKRG